MIKYKNTLFGLLLTTTIVLTTWISLSSHPNNIPSSNTSALPDAYMETVTATIMDKQGKPCIKIETPRMVHYAENDVSELNNPELTLYRKSPQPWFITAKFARATQGLDHVDFQDDVTIHHAADIVSPTTVIKTPKLTVHPSTQTAETDDLIVLTQPNIVVKAIGMTADINSGSINLLSAARGEYVPG